MASKKIKKPTSRNTKKQILASYEDLYKAYEALEKKVDKIQSVPTTAAAAAAAPPPMVVSAEGASISEIINKLKQQQGKFGGAVSTLSSQLTSEATRLATLLEESQEHLSTLESLHDIEVGDDAEATLHGIIEEYKKESSEFNEELDAKRSAFESEMEEKRSAWKKEQEEHKQAVKERDSELRRERRRENEEYEYKLEQERKLDREQYEEKKREREKELEEFVQEKEKAWEAREQEVSEREEAYDEAAAEAEELPEKLEAEVKKAKEAGAGIARYQAKVKSDLIAKQVEGEKHAFDHEIAAREQTIAEQARSIEELSRQLNAALKQAQDIAVKAIEGPSQGASFDALREIALEQARGNTRGK